MRSIVAHVIVLAFAVAVAVQPAGAVSVISIPFITTNCAIFEFPNSNTALTIEEFNSASNVVTDAESFNMKFPLFSDGIDTGPLKAGAGSAIDGATLGTGAKANILPFGPVNLAFPSQTQTVAGTYTSQRTYFFTDTLV